MTIPRFDELTEEQIDKASADELRAAYRALVRHHVEETEKLWAKLRALREMGADATSSDSRS